MIRSCSKIKDFAKQESFITQLYLTTKRWMWVCKNLKSYARWRDPPHRHHNFLANCINLNHQGMIADNNFFNDNIVRITIKNKFVHLYM